MSYSVCPTLRVQVRFRFYLQFIATRMEMRNNCDVFPFHCSTEEHLHWLLLSFGGGHKGWCWVLTPVWAQWLFWAGLSDVTGCQHQTRVGHMQGYCPIRGTISLEWLPVTLSCEIIFKKIPVYFSSFVIGRNKVKYLFMIWWIELGTFLLVQL